MTRKSHRDLHDWLRTRYRYPARRTGQLDTTEDHPMRDLMLTEDGRRRVHRVRLNGHEYLRVESKGEAHPPHHGARWYFIADVPVSRMADVAQHVDVTRLQSA